MNQVYVEEGEHDNDVAEGAVDDQDSDGSNDGNDELDNDDSDGVNDNHEHELDNESGSGGDDGGREADNRNGAESDNGGNGDCAESDNPVVQSRDEGNGVGVDEEGHDGFAHLSDSSNSSGHSTDDNEDIGQILLSNENEREEYILFAVREWALTGGIMSMTKLDKLLAILHVLHPIIPVSYKTLLHTPISVPVREVVCGQLWYKGIRVHLLGLDLVEYLRIHNKIELDISFDGLPLFRRSDKKFWPILGRLVASKNEPFVIAIYFGTRDPDVHEFLAEFVAEVRQLQDNGIQYNDRHYEFQIRH